MADTPTSTALERHTGSTAPAALSERDIKSIEFQARTIAALDNRLKDFDPDVRKEKAVALAITLHAYGLPITAPNAKKLHLIGRGDDAEIMESAQLLIGLLEARGHEVRVAPESNAELAIVRGWRFGGGRPYEVVYTLADAERSGALDEWVEEWKKDNGKWVLQERLQVIRGDDGQYRPKDPTLDMPGWATTQVRRGRVKRMDAWHKYRADMLVNRAVRRLAKRMGGDALLGIGAFEESDERERVDPPPPVRGDHDEHEPDDEDIEDAELVEEPTSSSATRDEGGETGNVDRETGEIIDEPTGTASGELDLERPFTED